MPRIRESVQHIGDQLREDLAGRLAGELAGNEQEEGPVIFEIPIKDTDTIHVIAIWKDWKGVSPEDRSLVIREAYEKLDEGKDPAERMSTKITLSIGATVDEALKYNLLPYSVISSVDRRDPRFEPIRQTMMRVGAIETSTGIELRFPTLQLAKAAYERMKQFSHVVMPDVYWQISQQAGSLEDD